MLVEFIVAKYPAWPISGLGEGRNKLQAVKLASGRLPICLKYAMLSCIDAGQTYIVGVKLLL